MMRWDRVWAIASAEARLTRRLARFWVFTIIAFLLGGLFLAQFVSMHYFGSGYSATVAQMNPRYFIAVVGNFYVVALGLALIFLGIEVRARDQRERVADVLDARPVSNTELLTGRMLGIAMPCYIASVIITFVFVVAQSLVKAPPIAGSVVVLLTTFMIPAFLLMICGTIFVTLLVRSRIVAAILMILIGILIVSIQAAWLPVKQINYSLVDVVGGFAGYFASDLYTGLTTPLFWVQRLGVALLGVGALIWAAAIHPRKDGVPASRRWALGAVCVLLGTLGVWSIYNLNSSTMHSIENWKQAHQAKADVTSPDLQRVKAEAVIQPGDEIVLKATLELASPVDRPLSELVLSLNPGYQIDKLTLDGQALSPTFEQGLLTAALPSALQPGSKHVVTLEAHGTIDRFFGYVDSAKSLFSTSSEDGPLNALGVFVSLFDDESLVLSGGGCWLPRSGTIVEPRTSTVGLEDPYLLDLVVELPEGWLAAGPGARRDEAGAASGRVRYRWNAGAPLHGPLLIAGEYESRRVEVEGTTLEVLIHPSHSKVFELLAPGGAAIEKWLRDRFADLKASGLNYPYDGITLAEIPGGIRGYGGGWRMPSAMGGPGVVMVREGGFATARLDVAFSSDDETDQEKKTERMVAALKQFFSYDFSGGNPFSLLATNLVTGQTSPAGPDRAALGFVVDNLAERIWFDDAGFFSAHIFNQDMNAIIGQWFAATFSGRTDTGSEALLKAASSRPTVWDALTSTTLTKLEGTTDPRRAVDALWIKGDGMSRSVLAEMGKTKAAGMLNELVRAHQGGSFTRDDLVRAAASQGVDLGPLLSTWLDSTGLPGFVASPVTVKRLTDGEGGVSRYQVLFTLRNDEAVPGIAAIACRSRAEPTGEQSGPAGASREVTEPIVGGGVVRIAGHSAMEVGCVTSDPPVQVRITPYLALNRDRFVLSVPTVDQSKISSDEPFQGAREVPYQPESNAIIVDDLDPGFTAESPPKKGLRLQRRIDPDQLDEGLPTMASGGGWRAPAVWSRYPSMSAYGRYRHTAAAIRPGKGEAKAVFTAKIPEAGRWQLSTFMPDLAGLRAFTGGESPTAGWKYKLEQGALTKDVQFAADAAGVGWNSLGEFDLSSGDVKLTLSDEAGGTWVFADAIRWSRVEGTP
jgi:ABC-type transport system involved in multi-copper enzyme maturation permease subunit